MLTLYLNPEKSPVAVQAKADGSPVSALKFKRGATVPLRIIVLGSSAATQLRIGIKEQHAFEDGLLVYGEAATGTAVEEGIAFDLTLSISSLALDAALSVGAGGECTPCALAAMTEFSWQEDGEARLSDTLTTTIYNDIIRLATEAPEAAEGVYPEPDLLATKTWVNNLRASAAAAGLVLLESDAIIESEYSAVALTETGTIAIPKATRNARGAVKLGTGNTLGGYDILPVGEDAEGRLAVDGSGLSAYALALRQGFEGTEADWLESLKGEPGEQGEKGDSGEVANIEEVAQATVAILAQPVATTRTHSTCTGSDNANFIWAQIDSAHLRSGIITAIEMPCRLTTIAGLTTTPLYMSIWQRNLATDTDLTWLATSTNAVTQVIGETGRWLFDNISLNGQDIRICFVSDPSSQWNATNALGARVIACTDGVANGCRIYTQSGNTNHLLELHIDFVEENYVFTPGLHLKDTTLHLSEEEHAQLSELLANKDALLALLNT